MNQTDQGEEEITASGRILHPQHGPHHPALATPARRPASVRRTTTHDSLRPQGLTGDVELVARGRDLLIDGEGRSRVVATAAIDARIDFMDGRRVREIAVQPSVPGLAGLVDVAASSGFRRAVDQVLGEGRARHPLRYQLLDDVPTAVLVSGYALGAGGVNIHPTGPRQQHPDLCAGWATGGTILIEIGRRGTPPMVTGPDAPRLADPGDPEAWHEMAALPPEAMRRWRRLDVWNEGDDVAVECFFRDSHVDAHGRESVVHEYTVSAALDPTTMEFRSCEAAVGALPWQECPGAVPSAGRLVGAPAPGLRQWVRESFVGPPTCTHLNDTLRSLEDIPYLAGLLAPAP